MSKELEKLEPFEITKPIRKKFQRRMIKLFKKAQLWSIDLCDNKHKINGTPKDCKFVMFMIDGWSKHLWISFLPNKTSESIINGLKDVLKQSFPRKPENLMSDMESGLFSKITQKFLKENGINLYHTHTGDQHFSSHNPFAETVIKTIKTWINRGEARNASGNRVAFDTIQEAVQYYNENHEHSTIKMTPEEASQTENQDELKEIYNEKLENYIPKEIKNTLKKNDFVRIHRWKKKFEKGFEPNFTKEIFRVYKVFETRPTTYILIDDKGEIIQGAFYKNQLFKVSDEILKIIFF